MTTKLRFVTKDERPPQERKAALREYAKKRRADNCNRDVKEELLIEHFYQAVFCEKAGAGMKRNFFIYLSFGLEAPTDKLISRLKEDGHRVYCPRIEEGEMIAVEHNEEFTLSHFGIREPMGERYEGEIDVAVVPFLAVDEEGNRLGYGKGYYDRFLKNSKALRVAYGYDFQIVQLVPAQPWDEKMDVIVTDEKIIKVEREV